MIIVTLFSVTTCKRAEFVIVIPVPVTIALVVVVVVVVVVAAAAAPFLLLLFDSWLCRAAFQSRLWLYAPQACSLSTCSCLGGTHLSGGKSLRSGLVFFVCEIP